MADAADRTLALLRRLVSCPSETPDQAGCLDIAAAELDAAGFSIERLPVGPVDNLWATHGSGTPGLVLCGHVDVVPPGDRDSWTHDPYTPTEVDGRLYGRGTTDMKGGVAAMLVAATTVARAGHPGTLAVALTSDEEGPARDGIRHVVATLRERGLRFGCGLVGEPSSAARLGDTLRVGRRGSLSCTIKLTGRQGHVAYPDRHVNPLLPLAQLATWLAARDSVVPAAGEEATAVTLVRLGGHGGAGNVVPAAAELVVNYRFNPREDLTALRAAVEAAAAATGLPATCTWTAPSPPYRTAATSRLVTLATAVISEVTGVAPVLSSAGGTSDGRFLADLCAEVVEFGSVGQTMHEVDENIDLAELGPLAEVYRRLVVAVLDAPAAGGG